uniref:Uncharacterized protein n=1 Tax=Anguilla anguilla TaxID=7936 RepID=A0A0E9VMY9_ANGAN
MIIYVPQNTCCQLSVEQCLALPTFKYKTVKSKTKALKPRELPTHPTRGAG